MLGSLSPVLGAVDADVLPGWSVIFPTVLGFSSLVVGSTSGCTVCGEASSLATVVEADTEPPWLVDASLADDWSERAFKVVLVPWWVEEPKRSGLVAGPGVTLLCASFVWGDVFPPAVTMPRLVFGPSVASVGTSVVCVATVECWVVSEVVRLLLVGSGKPFSVPAATSGKNAWNKGVKNKLHRRS